MKELVIVKDNQLYTTSLILAEKVQLEHRAIAQLIRKYEGRKIFKDTTFQMSKVKTKGRSIDCYFLTESQALFLLTLMRNSDIVVDFKENLVNAFMYFRESRSKVIIRKQNAEWLANKEAATQIRLEETDMIKKFVNYAIEQGSKNAYMYYRNISTMETRALFLVEQQFPNMRDALNIYQRNILKTADQAVICALEEGMTEKLHYKEIYKKAKERVEALAAIFPKTLISGFESPELLTNKTHSDII